MSICIAMNWPIAFRDIASGKYTLKQTENYGKWLSIQQTFARAATVQGQAALMQGRAAITNANANASYLKQLGGYYGVYWTFAQDAKVNINTTPKIKFFILCFFFPYKF